MFYAAVEMRDDPSLVTKPLAVGGNSMICTANYIARKYGVRSAMPGFIGRKLCPQLVFVPPNFKKYEYVGNQIRQIIAEYDANYESHSLDEVYFDLTAYVQSKLTSTANTTASSSSTLPSACDGSASTSIADRRRVAAETLNEIRMRITHDTGGLTCSAGLANNCRLAKICADINKPNGQYELPPTREAVLSFLDTLPTRKVGGVGKVTEKILADLGKFVCIFYNFIQSF